MSSSATYSSAKLAFLFAAELGVAAPPPFPRGHHGTFGVVCLYVYVSLLHGIASNLLDA